MNPFFPPTLHFGGIGPASLCVSAPHAAGWWFLCSRVASYRRSRGAESVRQRRCHYDRLADTDFADVDKILQGKVNGIYHFCAQRSRYLKGRNRSILYSDRHLKTKKKNTEKDGMSGAEDANQSHRNRRLLTEKQRARC